MTLVRIHAPWLLVVLTSLVVVALLSYQCGRIARPYLLRIDDSRVEESSTSVSNSHTSSQTTKTTTTSSPWWTTSSSSSSSFSASLCWQALVHPVLLAHSHPRRVLVLMDRFHNSLSVSQHVVDSIRQHKTVQEVVIWTEAPQPTKTTTLSTKHKDERATTTVHYHRDVLKAILDTYGDDEDPPLKQQDNDEDEDEDAQEKEDEAVLQEILEYAKESREEEEEEDDDEEEDPFDVILIHSPFNSHHLSLNHNLWSWKQMGRALSNALTDHGVLGGVLADGEQELGMDSRYYQMITTLEKAGGWFAFRDYVNDSPACRRQPRHGRVAPTYFYMATKHRQEVSQWLASEALVDLELARRIRPTPRHQTNSLDQADPAKTTTDDDNDDANTILMDGATMALYQVPSRRMEFWYCQTIHQHDGETCDMHGLDPDLPNLVTSLFEIRPATNPACGRGVFTKQDIVGNAYMGVNDGVHAMLIMPHTLKVIDEMVNLEDCEDYFEILEQYSNGYGMGTFYYGEKAVVVDPGIFTFLNHGCNGTYQTGNVLPVTEQTAPLTRVPREFRKEFYNPNLYRNQWVEQGCTGTIGQSMPANTELFDNYLFLSAGVSLPEWIDVVVEMRRLCSGEKLGVVSAYEQYQQK